MFFHCIDKQNLLYLYIGLMISEKMKKTNVIFVITLLLGLITGSIYAQSPLQYLETTFPQLTETFREDIDNCHAHYVFTIDVSGSMNVYEGTMVPLLKNFIQALPNGDKITIIPFGTETKNPMGFSGIISDEMKKTLLSNMEQLYHNSNYDQLFRDHTNIYKAINEISNSVTTNSEYKVNILIPFTDFLNNIPKVPPHKFNKRKLTEAELMDMQSKLKAAIQGCYVRCIAVELTDEGVDNKSQKEYCLDQLRDSVFNVAENGLEIIRTGNSKEAIGQWFEQLRRDILVVKLRAIVDSENKAGQVSMQTDIDIDGNTTAKINWIPTKLYQKIKIDSTYLHQEDFSFINDTNNYCSTRDTQLEIELGKIKNKELGFHSLKDSINLGISLPTDFDAELSKLGIVKPISGSESPIDKLIFTFPLPLWLTILILALLIIYIILFIRATIINSKDKMQGKITVDDEYGANIIAKKFGPCETISIGKAANIHVDDAEWTIQVNKVKPSPFLLFKTPYYRWCATKGYAGTKVSTEGNLDAKRNMLAKIKCGANKRSITHNVSIRLIEK